TAGAVEPSTPQSDDEAAEIWPAWRRTCRDTLQLEKSFAQHFSGTPAAAIDQLCAELAAGDLDLPDSARLTLSPAKETLTIEFRGKDQDGIENLEGYLIQSGWMALPAADSGFGKPKRSWKKPADTLREMRIEIDRRAEQLVSKQKEVEHLRSELRATEPQFLN